MACRKHSAPSSHGAISWTFFGEDLFKCLSELGVEYGVNNRVKKAIDVAQPREEAEEDVVKVTHPVCAPPIVAQTDGVDDVDSEKWHPTDKKHP